MSVSGIRTCWTATQASFLFPQQPWSLCRSRHTMHACGCDNYCLCFSTGLDTRTLWNHWYLHVVLQLACCHTPLQEQPEPLLHSLPEVCRALKDMNRGDDETDRRHRWRETESGWENNEGSLDVWALTKADKRHQYLFFCFPEESIKKLLKPF